MRISLRELMIVVAVAAVGMAGLKYASGGMGTVVQAMTGLVLLGLIVKAAVDRGRGQAFAVGFVLCAIVYLLVALVENPRSRSSPQTDIFGTRRLIGNFYSWIATTTLIEAETGKVVTDPGFTTPTGDAEFARVEWPTQSEPGRGDDADASANDTLPDDVDSEPDSADRLGRFQSFTGGDRRGRRGARGARGSAGRGRFAASSNLSSYYPGITPAQESEFLSADTQRQEEMLAILQMNEGREALDSGVALSSLKLVTYQQFRSPSLGAFRNVTYCLIALLIGYLGGLFARYVYGKRVSDREGVT